MRLLKAVGVLGWLSASGALAQEAPPSKPASEVPVSSAAEEGIQAQFGVQLGYAFATDLEGGRHEGPGARLQLFARFNDYFAVGPEVAFYARAGSSSLVSQRPGGGEVRHTREAGLVMLSTALRAGVDWGSTDEGLVLGLVLGPALAATEADGVLCYFLGMEVGFAPWKLPVIFDARIYRPLTGSESGHPNYVSLGLGTRF